MESDDAKAHGVAAEDRSMESDDAKAHGVAAEDRSMESDDAKAHGVKVIVIIFAILLLRGPEKLQGKFEDEYIRIFLLQKWNMDIPICWH